MEIKSVCASIEDELVRNFDYDRRSSFAHIERGKYFVEVFYDGLSGTLHVDLFGNNSGMELYNVQEFISDSIDVDKMENEIHMQELENERESEYEWDMRDALDHSPLYR